MKSDKDGVKQQNKDTLEANVSRETFAVPCHGAPLLSGIRSLLAVSIKQQKNAGNAGQNHTNSTVIKSKLFHVKHLFFNI